MIFYINDLKIISSGNFILPRVRRITLFEDGKKVKQSTTLLWRRRGVMMYSSYSFKTSALVGGEWSASRPGRALPPGKVPQVLIGQEGGWAPETV
jgi:hypothetical protein